jgi:hypothetical protein
MVAQQLISAMTCGENMPIAESVLASVILAHIVISAILTSTRMAGRGPDLQMANGDAW